MAVETTANVWKECRGYGTEKTKMQFGVREDLNAKTRNERSERREKKKKAAVDRRAKCRARSISRAGPTWNRKRPFFRAPPTTTQAPAGVWGGGGEFRQKYPVLRLIQRIFVKEMRQSRQILEDFISEIAIF